QFSKIVRPTLSEVPSLSGRAFLFYYLTPDLSRGFFIFFRDSQKNCRDGSPFAGARKKSLASVFLPFFDDLFPTRVRKKQFSTVFPTILLQTIAFFDQIVI
ncbi:MAG: hypothetical protein J6P88_04650, partial [Clostridia bacterium]|nr:hypothetical protein [Clostridia bacterium]